MSTPGVRAACEALRGDAAKWAAAAEALRGAARTAQNLVLYDQLGEIPRLAGSGKAITGYDEFRQKAATSLATGAVELDRLAAILEQAAAVYEQEDRAGYHRIAQAGADQ